MQRETYAWSHARVPFRPSSADVSGGDRVTRPFIVRKAVDGTGAIGGGQTSCERHTHARGAMNGSCRAAREPRWASSGGRSRHCLLAGYSCGLWGYAAG